MAEKLTSADVGANARDKINAAIDQLNGVSTQVSPLPTSITDLIARILRINAGLYPAERPGDTPTAFTASRAGGDPDALAPIDTNLYPLRVVGDGLGREISASRELFTRSYAAIESGRLWRSRMRLVRTVDPQDPSGDAIDIIVQWFDANRTPVGTPVTMQTITGLRVVDGPREISDFIGLAGVTGVTVARPPNCLYARVGVKAYGVEQRTVVTDLQVNDVSAIEAAIRRLVPADAIPNVIARLDDLTEEIASQTSAIDAIEQTVSATAARIGIETTLDPRWSSTVEFADGGIVSGVTANGGQFVDRDYLASLPIVCHLVAMGQSNMGGAECRDVRNGQDLRVGNIMLNGFGMKTWNPLVNPDKPWLRPTASFAFVPLQEGFLDGFSGETTASAMSFFFKTARIGGAFAPTDLSRSAPHIIQTFSCTGSQTITEIGPEDNRARPASATNQATYGAPATNPEPGPGGYYNTAIDDIIRVRDWAERIHGPNSYWPLGVYHAGHEDCEGGMLYRGQSPLMAFDQFVPAYKTKVIDLYNGLNSEWRRPGDHGRPIPCLMDQIVGDWTGTAAVQLADEHPSMYLVQPIYQWPSAINCFRGGTIRGAVVHMGPDAYVGRGLKVGQALNEIYSGRNWRPIRQIESRLVSPTLIRIRFAVKYGPLRFETTLLPTLLNYGFRVFPGTFGARGTERIITDVTIVGGDTVEIRLDPSTPVAAGSTAFVHYGMQAVARSSIPGPTAIAAGAPKVYTGGSLATTELTFAGDQMSIFNDMLKEGAFALRQFNGGGMAYNYVRSARLSGGATIVVMENQDAPAGTAAFVTGTAVSVERDRAGGNLCDSDDTRAAFAFADPWGTRQGKPLMMQNFAPISYQPILT